MFQLLLPVGSCVGVSPAFLASLYDLQPRRTDGRVCLLTESFDLVIWWHRKVFRHNVNAVNFIKGCSFSCWYFVTNYVLALLVEFTLLLGHGRALPGLMISWFLDNMIYYLPTESILLVRFTNGFLIGSVGDCTLLILLICVLMYLFLSPPNKACISYTICSFCLLFRFLLVDYDID